MTDSQYLNLITTIYVAATIVIAFSNFKSAKASKEQTEEIKKQYNEQNRPDIDVYFDILGNHMCVFILRNIGNKPATNLTVSINNEFINNMSLNNKNHIEVMCNSKLYMSPNTEKNIYLGGIGSNFQNLCKNKAMINIKYDGYEKAFEFDLNDYSWMIVKQDYDAMSVKALENINDNIKELKKTMKENNFIPKINIDLNRDTLLFKIYAYICENQGCKSKEIINELNINEEMLLENLKLLTYTFGLITFIDDNNFGDINNKENIWFKR